MPATDISFFGVASELGSRLLPARPADSLAPLLLSSSRRKQQPIPARGVHQCRKGVWWRPCSDFQPGRGRRPRASARDLSPAAFPPP